MHYAVRDLKDIVYAREFFITQSDIEVDDDSLGLFDEPINHHFEEWFLSEYTILK